MLGDWPKIIQLGKPTSQGSSPGLASAEASADVVSIFQGFLPHLGT